MADIVTLSWFAALQRAHNYARSGHYYVSTGANAMEQGVKIHISANADSIGKIGPLILPHLVESRVLHKVLADTDMIAQARTVNQYRKFITAYPQNAEQLDDLCESVERLLKRCAGLPAGSAAECFPIAGDLPYGLSGYTFLRHGYFKKDDAADDRTTVSEPLRAAMMHDTVESLFVADRYDRSQPSASALSILDEMQNWGTA